MTYSDYRTAIRVAEALRERWLDPDHIWVCPECGIENEAPKDEPCDCGWRHTTWEDHL
jgi:rubrerythrin